MALYRATVRIQDGNHYYLQKRWLDADNHSHAQEIAEKWMEVLNSDPQEYRGYELRAVEDKDTVIKQIRDVDTGKTEATVEKLLDNVKQITT
jgi:hypothetical protein